MRSLPDRKKKVSLVVEFLEDRQLLSHPGSSMGWDPPAMEFEGRSGPPAPLWGPMVASRGQGDGPMPGGRPADGPSSIHESDGPPAPTGACATPSPTVAAASFGGPHGPGPAGDPAPGGGASSPQPPVDGQGSPKVATPSENGPPAPPYDHGTDRAAAAPNLGAAPASSVPSARGSSPGPITGLSPSYVPTARVEPVEILPVPSTVALASPIPSLNGPANGPGPIEVIHGPGSAVGQLRLGLDDGTARGFAEARPPDDSPFSSGWEAGETQAGSGLTEVAGAGVSSRFDAPEPQAADMITSLLPFDRSTLEAAIDQLLEPLDGLASTVPGLRGPMGLVTASMTVAVTVLAVDLALRIRRSRAEELELEAEGGLVAFPGLPGTRRWSRP